MGVGNPSRGDDALGPLCLEALADALAGPVASGAVELLTDFQLQVEMIYDLQGRSRVVFVDASVRVLPPYRWAPVAEVVEAPTTSHALSPEALVACHRRLLGPPPPAWLLEVRGDQFELGTDLAPEACVHLELAVARLVAEVEGMLLELGPPPR